MRCLSCCFFFSSSSVRESSELLLLLENRSRVRNDEDAVEITRRVRRTSTYGIASKQQIISKPKRIMPTKKSVFDSSMTIAFSTC